METTTWAKALVWFVASQVVYFTMLFVTIPAIENKTQGMKIFDLMTTGYSQQYVIAFLENIGEKGRNIYLSNQIPLDLIYPSLMAVTGALFIALFARKINPRLGAILFIPIFGALFDYLENMMVAVMLLSYPDIPKTIVLLSSMFTIMKTFLVPLYLVLLLVLFVIYLYKIVRGKGRHEGESPIT